MTCILLHDLRSCALGDDLERELFIVRKLVEKEKVGRLAADKAFDFYTCSLSTRTIVYKVR
jgi:glutamate synthase (ferredoxin)